MKHYSINVTGVPALTQSEDDFISPFESPAPSAEDSGDSEEDGDDEPTSDDSLFGEPE